LLDWFSTLNMVVIISSEILVGIRTRRRYIPEDGNSHNYHSEDLKSYHILALKWLECAFEISIKIYSLEFGFCPFDMLRILMTICRDYFS
jgi:hypothetical protein